MTLFGFGTAAEREAFRALTSFQGVGGRLALAILSVLSPDELARAVSTGDKAMIARASGVGPKLAQRIALELQGKLGLPAALGRGRERSGGGPGRATRFPRSPTLASSRPKPAPRSPPQRTSSAPTRPLDALVRLALKKAAR